MSKVKSIFFCQECGAQYAKWQGQCNKCNSWNSISEELQQDTKKRIWDHVKSDLTRSNSNPKSIDDIEIKDEFRIKTIRTIEDAYFGIKNMIVRGAPLIGVTGGYGFALGIKEDPSDENLIKCSNFKYEVSKNRF